jgi:hypothetical protein
MAGFNNLRQYLRSLQPGEINDSYLEVLVAACWGRFAGGELEGITGDKLPGRMERVRWEPPLLSFVIERHGGTVRGSSRAELQEWMVDMNTRTATPFEAGHRQLQPMAPKVDVERLAAEVLQLMIDHAVNDRLRWYPDGAVRVEIGKILPASNVNKQTLQGRRRRFRQALEELVHQAGGQTVRANVYRLPDA